MNDKVGPSGRSGSLREQAEKIARERTGPLPEVTETMTHDQIRTMLHELRVHQIQLEMQNEELRNAQVELERARERYFELYDMAPVGYCTISETGLIMEANLAAAGLLEVSRSALVQKPFSQFILKKDQDVYYLHLHDLSKTGVSHTCELRMVNKSGGVFWARMSAMTAKEVDDLPIFRVVLSDISDQKKAEIDLKYLSMHDILTGLYNRSYFEESLRRFELGRHYPITILMADVDNLKYVNDQYGHGAGDQLLKRVAHLFTITFRADDVIARIGGDEFAILMPGTNSPAAEDSLLRFQTILEEHNAAYCEILLQLSCGIATAPEKTSLIEILKEADMKMYLEKKERNGRNGR